MGPKRLWADIPPAQRIDEAFVRTCNGASDRRWLARVLHSLERPECAAAVRWGDRYAPCRRRIAGSGERFCAIHGGARSKIMVANWAECQFTRMNWIARMRRFNRAIARRKRQREAS